MAHARTPHVAIGLVDLSCAFGSECSVHDGENSSHGRDAGMRAQVASQINVARKPIFLAHVRLKRDICLCLPGFNCREDLSISLSPANVVVLRKVSASIFRRVHRAEV